MKLLFVSLLTLSLLPEIASAQLFQCEGKWTNKPCQGTVQKELAIKDEKTGIVGISTDPDRSKKSSLYHELMMKSVKAKNDFQIETNLDAAQEKCLYGNSTLEECQKQIETYNKDLDYKTHNAEIIKLKKEEIAVQKEKNKISQENNKTTIIERQPIYIIKNNEFQNRTHPETSVSITATSSNGKNEIKAETQIIKSESDLKKTKVKSKTAIITQ